MDKENQGQNVFFDILEENEKVEKVFKPNKKKFLWSAVTLSFLCSFYIYIWVYVMIASSQFGENGQRIATYSLYIWFLPVIAFALQIVLTIVFAKLSYKNRYYAYTDSRILIRSGIFGIDYQSLEMKSVGAINANVSLLDKMVNKNTGTVIVGSNSSPVGYPQKSGGSYKFANVEDPYALCRELKAKIRGDNEKQTRKIADEQ